MIDTNKVRMQFREDHSIAGAMIYGLCDELDHQRRMTEAAWDSEQRERQEFRVEIAAQRHHVAKLRAELDRWARLAAKEDHEWLRERDELYRAAREAEALIDLIQINIHSERPSLGAIDAIIGTYRAGGTSAGL